MKRFALIAGLTLAGCANPGIVQIAPDTYMISRTDKGGIFGNASAMKAEAFQEANDFAAAKGKVAIPVTVQEQPMRVGAGFASIDIQFRTVEPNSPEAKNFRLTQRPDVVIEKNERSTVNVNNKPDTYSELLKLDDLLKRGIINQSEFDAQKRRLLAQ